MGDGRHAGPEPTTAPTARPQPIAASDSPRALRSTAWIAFFDHAFTRAFRRDMRALRLARWGRPDAPPGSPLVILATHPSWWDGVMVMLLGRRLFPDREVFAPMEAEALARYPFMRRIGVFGVAQHTTRGAARFLHVATEILAPAPRGRVLWVHAPGRFADIRERPVPIAPGIARLAEIAPPETVFLPLAVEYAFWTERRPETLAAFGAPIAVSSLLALDRTARAARLSAALAETMDRLAEDAMAREPARFETLLRGREGIGGAYAMWRRLTAALRGRAHDPRHDPRSEKISPP